MKSSTKALLLSTLVAGSFLGERALGSLSQIPVADSGIRLMGGFQTDAQDHGRPVVLIAAGLGVPTTVFREAFSHVIPAPAGREPEAAQVRKNKAALLSRLSAYGVTNEAIDRVSNYYRYNESRGEWWPYCLGKIEPVRTGGEITGFKIVRPGFGYSSEPMISVAGYPNMRLKVDLAYGKDLTKNGSIANIRILTGSK